MLVIDGAGLERCIKEEEKLFFMETAKMNGVICCRCSPLQKTEIVKKMKLYTGLCVAAIGDGGNDVGMIQEADVGIGIVGKEGKHASLAADFSILQFNTISRLLFWHGRLSYIRTAALGQFVVHRGLIIAIIQAIFIMMFYYSAIPVFNSYLLLGYASYYTCAPVFCLVFDRDVDNEEVVFKYPNLYQNVQKGRLLSPRTILRWTAQSIYQGAVIMLSAVLFFEDSFPKILGVAFTALMMIELLNLYTELRKANYWIYGCLLLSFGVYMLTIVAFKDYFNVHNVGFKFLVKALIIALAAWAPIHIISWMFRKLDPSDAARIEK